MLVKVTLQSDADDYRDLLVANLKQDGAGLKDFPRQGFTPMHKWEDPQGLRGIFSLGIYPHV